MGMEQQYVVIADRWWHSDTDTIWYNIIHSFYGDDDIIDPVAHMVALMVP